MNNAQKAIMIGVGLFLTILIISVVLLVTNTGIGTTKDAEKNIIDLNSSFEQQLLNQYKNDMIITADDVVVAINKYIEPLNNNVFVMLTGDEIHSVHPNVFSQDEDPSIIQVEPNTKEGLIALIDPSKKYYSNYHCFDDYEGQCALIFSRFPMEL